MCRGCVGKSTKSFGAGQENSLLSGRIYYEPMLIMNVGELFEKVNRGVIFPGETAIKTPPAPCDLLCSGVRAPAPVVLCGSAGVE